MTNNVYDPFGRVTSKADANGNITTYEYTARSGIAKILYPDGSHETYLYANDGSLLNHKDRAGLTIQYDRDVLGRTLSKTYLAPNGECLGEEQFTYNGFNLISKTDLEGNLTSYTYDGADRKIKEDYAGHVTTYAYDSLSRLAKEEKQNGSNSLSIHYRRDLLGRILSEMKTDAVENILYEIAYTYDEDGNRASITRNINGNQSIETFTYDPFRRLVLHVDPLNNTTTQLFDENVTNEIGQTVLQKTNIDCTGIATIETKDAFNRLSKKERVNTEGVTLSSSEIIYDPHGNVTYQKDHVYSNGLLQNTQVIKHSYTSTHAEEDLIKGFGGKDANTTSFTYHPSGKLKTKSLPNGTTLSYEYNSLGSLKDLKSSDGNIWHTFEYNNLGNLTSAKDENLNITISRRLDIFGNIVKEEFPQFAIEREYDERNRLIWMKIPGCGTVSYEYDPLYLRNVTRIAPNGQLYTHQYESYDLNGVITSERLIENLGRVNHKSSLRGEKTHIASPFFTQECAYNALGNLIKNVKNQSENHYTYDGMSQLISEKDNLYAYNSLYNRTIKNDQSFVINDLNQTLSSGNQTYSYDLNGNQTTKKTDQETFSLIYDALNRLIEATSSDKRIVFTYDPLGRCLNKTSYEETLSGYRETDKEYYLYHNEEEIGSLDEHLKPKTFKVLGINRRNNALPIAIELEGKIFAPSLDVQGNVCQLIDIDTKNITNQYEYTSFGESIQKAESLFNPWLYAGKRLDQELQLINFGKRYYDPELAKWLSQDPEGFVDSSNLYQYVFNNPFKYKDPDGRFVVAIPLFVWGTTWALPTFTAVITPIVYGTCAAAVTVGTYYACNKVIDVYAPDRDLPTKNGEPVPDETPEDKGRHSQLGTREGSKGKYPKARQFDKDGNIVKEIEFTDHSKPSNHPCPHQHVYEPNATGGTPRRGKKAEEVSYEEVLLKE